MKNDKYILITFPESQYYEDYDISDGVSETRETLVLKSHVQLVEGQPNKLQEL